MPKLTKRLIDDLSAEKKQLFAWDSELRGFGVLVMPSGVKSFIVQYRNAASRSHRMTLGRYGVLTVDEARKQAQQALSRVISGEDPMTERRSFRASPTVSDLLDRYLSDHVALHNAPSTAKDVTVLVNQHIRPRLGTLKVNGVTRADIAKMHNAMRETPRRANYALSILSKAFSLAELWGFRGENTNPCRAIPRYPENQRKRFLNADELERIGQVLIEAETIGLPWEINKEQTNSKHLAKENNRRTLLSWPAITAIRLLLFTGARLNEILALQRTDIDQKTGTIALPGKKGGEREAHPVSKLVLDLITALPRLNSSPWLLPRLSDSTRHVSKEVVENAWQRIRWRAGLEDVRIHDLRHTVGTYAAQAGVSSFIVRDLLRHKNITTTARYANFDVNPVRDVSDVVAERIAAHLGAK